MPLYSVREEVINVLIAELLEKRGLLSVPETIRKAVGSKGRKLPDITVADLLGIRMVIEGRFDTSSDTRQQLFKDAKSRVEEGISPICLALLYPTDVRQTDTLPKLRGKLEKAGFHGRIISEAGDGQWSPMNLDGIGEALRRAYELLVTDDVVIRSVGELEQSIEAATELFMRSSAVTERFRQALGIPKELDSTTAEYEVDAE
jgi:hypothetical protein